MKILILSSLNLHFPLDVIPALKEAGYDSYRYDSLEEFIASPHRAEPFLGLLELGHPEDLDRALIAYEFTDTVQPRAPARYLLLAASKNISLRDKAGRFGGVDVAHLPMRPKNLVFKIELQLRLLEIKTEKKAGRGFRADDNGPERERVLVFRGPGPQSGHWRDSGEAAPQGKIRWRWVESPEKKPKPEDYSWSTVSREAPKFDEPTKTWRVDGKEADLQCHQNGAEIYSAMREAQIIAAGQATPPTSQNIRARPGEALADSAEKELKMGFSVDDSAGREVGFGASNAETTIGGDPEAEKAEYTLAKNPTKVESAAHEAPVMKISADQTRRHAHGPGEAESKEQSVASAEKKSNRAELATQRLGAKSAGEADSKEEAKKQGGAAKAESPIASSPRLAPSPEKKAAAATLEELGAKPKNSSFADPKAKTTNVGNTSKIEKQELAPKGAEAEKAKESAPTAGKEEVAAKKIVRFTTKLTETDAKAGKLDEGHAQKKAAPAGAAGGRPTNEEKQSVEGADAAKDGERARDEGMPYQPERIESVAAAPTSGAADAPEATTLAANPPAADPTTASSTKGEHQREGLIFLQGRKEGEGSEAKFIPGSVRQAEDRPTDHLKMRQFYTLSLTELNDQNSSWHPVEGFRIYLSAQHRYYGVKNLAELFPLWTYEGELAPEFLDLKFAWKFYDRLPRAHETLAGLPENLVRYLHGLLRGGVEHPSAPGVPLIRPAADGAAVGSEKSGGASDKEAMKAKENAGANAAAIGLAGAEEESPSVWKGLVRIVRKIFSWLES